MAKHKHEHASCLHENVKWCRHCNYIFCEDCDITWHQWSWTCTSNAISQPVRYPNPPYWGWANTGLGQSQSTSIGLGQSQSTSIAQDVFKQACEHRGYSIEASGEVKTHHSGDGCTTHD